MVASRGRSRDVKGVADTACKVGDLKGGREMNQCDGERKIWTPAAFVLWCFASTLEKEAAWKQQLIQDRLWINSLQSPRNYMNGLIYCWRLQEVNPAYWSSNISQEQYKAFHTRAEQLKCRVYKRSWSKHINLQRQVKQGYIFLVETDKRNIPW